MAFLGMLQSIGLFKKLSKLHITISQSGLLVLEPEQLGMRIVKDALKVDHLVITVTKDQDVRNLDMKIYTTVFKNLILSVKSRSFVLDIGSCPIARQRDVMTLTNENVEEFK